MQISKLHESTITYSAPKGPIDYLIDTLTTDKSKKRKLIELRKQFKIVKGFDGNDWYGMTKEQSNKYHELKFSKSSKTVKRDKIDTYTKYSISYIDSLIDKNVSNSWKALLTKQRLSYKKEGNFYLLTTRQEINIQEAKRNPFPNESFNSKY